jgi:hypothetical protein
MHSKIPNRGERVADKESGWGLFYDLGHQVKPILSGRCYGLKGGALIGFGHYIGAQALDGIERMRHRRYTLGIHRLQLIYQRQNLRNTFGGGLGGFIANGDARQVGEFCYIGTIYSHYLNSRKDRRGRLAAKFGENS